MTDNALDPLPRRRSGRVPYPRIAAIVAGVVISVGLVLVVGNIVFNHSATQQVAAGAGFGRGGASSGPVAPTPPAVAPAQAAQADANLQALQKAAESPALAARSSQVATVSPPAGPAPGGVGVVRSKNTVGPAAA